MQNVAYPDIMLRMRDVRFTGWISVQGNGITKIGRVIPYARHATLKHRAQGWKAH